MATEREEEKEECVARKTGKGGRRKLEKNKVLSQQGRCE